MLESLLGHCYFVPKLPALCVQTSATCVTCAQNNASQRPRPNSGVLSTMMLDNYRNYGVDYMFQGCMIRKNTATNEYYYQAELADLQARSILITKLSDVKKIAKE